MTRHWVVEAALRALRRDRDRLVADLAHVNEAAAHKAKRWIVQDDKMIEDLEKLDG